MFVYMSMTILERPACYAANDDSHIRKALKRLRIHKLDHTYIYIHIYTCT